MSRLDALKSDLKIINASITWVVYALEREQQPDQKTTTQLNEARQAIDALYCFPLPTPDMTAEILWKNKQTLYGVDLTKGVGHEAQDAATTLETLFSQADKNGNLAQKVMASMQEPVIYNGELITGRPCTPIRETLSLIVEAYKAARPKSDDNERTEFSTGGLPL